ncbi:hypothetical protein BTO30_10690 [Domibacillus antri]|uniref:Nucleotidyltransferase n=1 Tax=Domibacillus antri TaxID=1714264 RepID=A0A1Q8Q4F2_9BACI|nr:nucleotidyltransferase domain-containing protein [Domibacillus antri]OLN22208.1 hypothetical protein BTO30_10690 [Domibacillus antri]
MKETILKTLEQIEKDHHVKVLYACESGSRAWGVSSKDSDYDVRFIYVHPPDSYLSIDPVGIGKKRDVIELPVNVLLDVSGWELTKALKLFRKSNPPLFEWLGSNIVYYEAYSAIEEMKKMKQRLFSPSSCLYHYLNMANQNFGQILRGGQVTPKHYINVLRPVLAAKWIEQHHTFPPLELQTLLEQTVPEKEVKMEFERLLKQKIAGETLNTAMRFDLMNDFLTVEIARMESYAKKLQVNRPDPTRKLDLLFQNTLEEAWH